ncbi:MAG: ribonuclease T2 [Bradyrhizobiaceae bacterium]|nr:ribonuclease T2 [Bradyrhizobiaceae bacterium]
MNHPRGLIAALGLVAVLSVASPASAQNRGAPGKFDFYVLALSWSPSYCEAEGDRRRGNEQCSRGRPFAFVVHGLWPQHERGYPRACANPAPRIPDRLIDSMLDLMPARGLVIHEWREHGTCSGLGADGYFNAVRRARERVAVPERFRRLNAYEMVAPVEVEDAFRAVNPELKPDMIAVTCDHRWLREVRICLNRDLTFRACPDVDRRACRTPRIAMPPVRG